MSAWYCLAMEFSLPSQKKKATFPSKLKLFLWKIGLFANEKQINLDQLVCDRFDLDQLVCDRKEN